MYRCVAIIRLSLALIIAALPLAAGATTATVDAEFGYGELRLEFSQPMQTWDNRRDTGYVRLTPALPATCSWDSDTVLSCGFGDSSPRPATGYRIELAPGLKTQAGDVLPRQVLRADTQRPKLTASIERWHDGTPEIVVRSNLETSPQRIMEVLRLQVDGVPTPLRALRALPKRYPGDSNVRYALVLRDALRPDTSISLAVVPGLESSAGSLRGIQREILQTAIANEPLRVRGASCTARHASQGAAPRHGVLDLYDCLPGTPVQLLFTRNLQPAARAAWVRTWPEAVQLQRWEDDSQWQIEGGAERSVGRSPSQSVALEIDAANTVIELPVPATLVAAADAAAIEPLVIRIHTGDYQPALQAPHASALIVDGRALPTLATVRNAGQTTIPVLGIGRGTRGETLQTPALRSNASTALASDATARTLAEGGWVRWSPQRSGDAFSGYEFRSTLQFAAPAFDLFAVTGRRQVLVWANAWEGDRAVSGADVELLWLADSASAPHVVARGTTAKDGTVLLTLPDSIRTDDAADADGSPLWLLRAATGRRAGSARAVLPLGQPSRWGNPLGLALATRVWGVSDRPLYRAGDTVRYHLWQRVQDGNRLLRVDVPQPLALQLSSQDEDKTILEFPATPDASGAIDGELALPAHLPDATYCIGRERGGEGSCFFVGTYRAQDLWAEARVEDRVLRNGDPFGFDITAGYYSGGPAAAVVVRRVNTMLTPLPLQQAYPRFADYTFIDVHSAGANEGVALAGTDALQLITGHDGRVSAKLPVAFKAIPGHALPAFGRLQVTAELKLSDRDSTVTNAAEARYSRYSRFVGLRIEPSWLDATTPVRIEGQVIEADGSAVVGASVDVEVHYLPDFEDRASENTKPRLLARCHLKSGVIGDCNFPRERSGRYRLTAHSGTAASTVLTHYVWVDGDNTTASNPVNPALELLQAPQQRGAAARVLLKQPHATGRILFVFSANERLLGYRVETIAGDTHPYLLPSTPDWGNRLQLTAYVRTGAASLVKNGYRLPVAMQNASLQIPLPARPSTETPLALAFERAAAKPGEDVRITLRNQTARPREVVVAVVDDALRALASDFLPYFDPHGEYWLGAHANRYGRNTTVSYVDWNDRAWFLPLPWEAEGSPPSDLSDAEPGPPQASPPPPPPPPPPAPAPPVIFDTPAPMDVASVTGSRIALADAFSVGPVPLHGLRPRELVHGAGPLAHVRTRFADTALWRSQIHLAPGESHVVVLKVPDNLTRWRALAWSSDADEDFDMAQATLEVGLPVEVRLQTPTRLYPGDHARFAANVRQTGDAIVVAHAHMRGEGSVDASTDQALTLSARGQASFAMEVAPDMTGALRATASAETSSGQDAVAASVDIASPLIEAHNLQAGWLDGTPVSLSLPSLPVGASEARVHLSLMRGDAGLLQRWTRDLRDYPHRCWEQILSRAVAAALAIERDAVADWPDARAVVQEALDNAAVFQGEDGDFRYFAESTAPRRGWPDPEPQVELTAYTAQALALLRGMGYAVDDGIQASALEFLARAARQEDADNDESAFAAAALEQVPSEDLAALWTQWDKLSVPAQVAAVRAFAQAGLPQRHPAFARLMAASPERGGARVLHLAQRFDRWMSSDLREQCALLRVLQDFPDLADAATAIALRRGLTDLYSGGIAAVDTQTGAYCLMALRSNARPSSEAVTATVQAGGETATLQLPAGRDVVNWEAPMPMDAKLRIAPAAASAASISYVAELRYREDARQALSSAVGLSVERQYQVLHQGKWSALAGLTVREGDWIRITLTVRCSAPRYFVALTDSVPGGLRPTDLSLTGQTGLDLDKVSDEGSGWFRTRRLDARSPRFYAEFLPAGQHELHYFAKVGNSGDYLAAPAVAELMYGNATAARTAATRVQFEPAAPPR